MTTHSVNKAIKRTTKLSGVLAATFGMLFAFAGDRPTGFIAVYDVHHSGALIAETTVMLTRTNPDSYLMSSTTLPKGFAALLRKAPVTEHSRFEFSEDNQMRGINYEFDDGSRSGKRNRSISFDWDTNKAVSNYKSQTYTIDLEQPVGDRLAMQALLMRDLGENELQQSYRLVDRDALKTYLFTTLGEELLDTPAGRFNTVKIRQQREGSSRSYHIWLAQEHDFATVKMTQFKNDKLRTVLTATRIQSGVAQTPKPVVPQPEDSPATNSSGTDLSSTDLPEKPGNNDLLKKAIDHTKSGPVVPEKEADQER